jgi:pimeloyl-ACP methyl ester carboxylesterase
MGDRTEDFSVSPAPGVHLEGSAEGSGVPIVLLHGLTATRRYVLQGSRMLARNGHRVFAYDARGHGESGPAPDPGGYEYADLAGDLRVLLDELEIESPVLAGSSMGAATTMALSLAEPERVAALVQVTPAYGGAARTEPGDWPQLADDLDAGDLEAFLEHVGMGRLSERFREAATIAVRQRLERHRDLHAVADAVRVVPYSEAFEGLDGLDGLDVPVLVVGSRDEADPEHPLAVAEEYARRLPRARLVVEDEGESPLAWRGAQLSRAIAEFLADLP